MCGGLLIPLQKYRCLNSSLLLILELMIGLLVLTLSACAFASPTATTPPPTATKRVPSPTPTVATPPLPTPIPQQLVLCSVEPQAVNPFIPSQAGEDLLALFYELPAERVGYQWQARLLTQVPSLENGQVLTRTASVPSGARYADAAGTVHIHQGTEALRLSQMVVTFTLKSDLRWSDGQPLTAADAIFSYHLAQSPEAHGHWRTLVERTHRFTAVDDQTLRWEGLPGYLSADYPGFCFPPQPAHRWQGKELTEIVRDRTPPATGPFEIIAWETGREVRMQPNPYYVGEAPVLEEVIVRFPQLRAEQWPELLTSGQCDVLLPDPVQLTDWQTWERLVNERQAMIWADVAPTVLRLDFNIAATEEISTPLSQREVRLGLAHCIDRANLSAALPSEALLPASGFIPPAHPAFDEAGDRIPYNQDKGKRFLEEAGWYDEDGDGIREAHDVPGIRDDTPLSLTLHLAAPYIVTAAHLSADLEKCGVGVQPEATETQLLYAADPVSPLFGRSFEMALFGWQVELPQVCGSWRSDRIPSAESGWIGENFSGYTDEEYDRACTRALTSIDPATQAAALQEAQTLLKEELPTLFLTWRPYWFVTSTKVQGLRPDASASGTIWNIEGVSIQPQTRD